jgi:UDP-2,3-diacylglucosamine pyrophosphatase LpxH
MANGNKRIFISDIHMGDQRSINPYPPHPHPYGWLRDNIQYVAAFLADLPQMPDVSEVIILGDLFDQWVIPDDLDPLAIIEPICAAPANQAIIANLKKLAGSSQIKLTYVPGNHDISNWRGAMEDTGEFIKQTFPGINFISDPNQPTGVYRAGKLAAEHGNMYCLFCAPDTWTDPVNSFLPIGYFVSRIAATVAAATGKPENLQSLTQKHVPEPNCTADSLHNLFQMFAGMDLVKWDEINMTGIHGFPAGFSILKVCERYFCLPENWDKTHPAIDAAVAFYMDACGDLNPAFEKIYVPRSDTNIVIFGHTHKPVMVKKPGPSDPCTAIYANSGTWIDGQTCTYVETEEDPATQRHYVRIKSYPGNNVLNEGYVNL